MDTNNWFFSRRNVAGMILAIIAIALHLAVGLGSLWPLVALCAYGVGAVLTPSASKPELAAPRTLVDAIESSTQNFRALGVGQSSIQELGQLKWTIGQLERHMDELAAQPILLQTVNEIAYSHVPTLEAAFAEVPDIARGQAIGELDNSLRLLNEEAGKILNAIVQQKFKGLEDQRAELEQRFTGVSLYLDGPSQN